MTVDKNQPAKSQKPPPKPTKGRLPLEEFKRQQKAELDRFRRACGG